MDIFFYYLRSNINLTPEWVLRELNHDADYYSKIADTDSWSIGRKCFDFINSHFGPFSVDRFADDRNKMLKSFHSSYYCPGTSHVNVEWENQLALPPISLIGSTLRHLRICEGHGALLVPVWESSYCWPLIYPNGLRPAYFIKDILTVNPNYEGYNQNDIFSGFAPFSAIALKLDFTS